MGGEFRRELAAVLVAPKQLRRLAVRFDAHDAEVVFGVVRNVFEILAGAGHEEDLARKFLGFTISILSCTQNNSGIIRFVANR